jgi:hypothetical protein
MNCGHTGELFCDGFESDDTSAWSGGTEGAVAVQSVNRHGGSFALQVTADGVNHPASLRRPLASVSSGSIHGRAWFFVPSSVMLAKADVLTMSNTSLDLGVVFLVDQNKLVAYDEIASTNATITSGTPIPSDQWFCVELHVAISTGGTDGGISLDLNGQNIAMGDQLNTMLGSTGYNYLELGMKSAQSGQPSVSFFVDDVVVGTQPIGCD